MFERDKDELRAMGVPVATLTDASGVVTGYRIEGDWSLPPLALDRAELALLGLAARVWQSADLAPAALNALRKVEASLGMEPVAAGPTPIAGLTADSAVLPALIAACSARQPVTFAYRKSADLPTAVRHVQPWGVVWWRAHWYLVGMDCDRADVRVFRASRIEGAVRPDTSAPAFTVPEGFDARAAIGRFGAAERVDLEVALAPGAGAALRRAAEPPAGPDVDHVRIAVDDLATGVARVLSYGAAARVAGPAAAVAEARRQLDALVAAHESPAPRAGRMLGASAARGPASAQFSRLLALVPWLAANSGVRISAAAAQFGITEEQLLADLGSVITSGADDWTLFDIQYWDTGGVIEVIDALELGRPLTLTPDEGFALLVALQALHEVPGSHDRAVLDSVIGKVRATLGAGAPAPGALAVRVDLPDSVVALVDEARAAGRAVEVSYLGAVRDEVTHRVVDPVAVVVVDGYGYLRGFCRSAGGMRLFRVDRILDLRVSPLPAEPVADAPDTVEPMAVALAATGRRVVVDLPATSPVLERHPVLRRWGLPGGAVRAELPVGEYDWARRLVLGAAGEVVLREPEWLVQQVLDTARQARAAHAGNLAPEMTSL
jgi:proteasome accessory factor B/proteasome accessory factor C